MPPNMFTYPGIHDSLSGSGNVSRLVESNTHQSVGVRGEEEVGPAEEALLRGYLEVT